MSVFLKDELDAANLTWRDIEAKLFLTRSGNAWLAR
jgi:hypothetical protein